MKHLYYKSPAGLIQITGTEQGVVCVDFVPKIQRPSLGPIPTCLKQCHKQLQEYFLGKRNQFKLSFSLQGTDFQKRVWRELQKIPFGQTRSYGEIAQRIKNKAASRAVGMACHTNKLSIIVPCHRVVGKNGSLTGYAGGLWRKKKLLEHEQQAQGTK